jgi:hypothetical protein
MAVARKKGSNPRRQAGFVPLAWLVLNERNQ